MKSNVLVMIFTFLVFSAVINGCGKKGPPLPPKGQPEIQPEK